TTATMTTEYLFKRRKNQSSRGGKLWPSNLVGSVHGSGRDAIRCDEHKAEPSRRGRTAMKFRVERDALADAVAWTAKSLPSRPSVPVLAGVMLRVGDGVLTVSGFDYE